jgi:hypothetical protein
MRYFARAVQENAFYSEKLCNLLIRKFLMKSKAWKYAVVGGDSHGPRYLSFRNGYNDAIRLRGNAIVIGWRAVTIYDTRLREVKEKPAMR